MMRCAGCRHLDLSAVVIIHPIVLWLEFPFLAHCTSTGLPILPREGCAGWQVDEDITLPLNCSISTRMSAISKFPPPENEFR